MRGGGGGARRRGVAARCGDGALTDDGLKSESSLLEATPTSRARARDGVERGRGAVWNARGADARRAGRRARAKDSREGDEDDVDAAGAGRSRDAATREGVVVVRGGRGK